ncbi:S41 family peptidase [Ekhidna sp.]|uniref:S41 family peptidase n=1 Tax=Ekhidna sp. TaxID=2608089 RepID=UPI003BAC5B8B
MKNVIRLQILLLFITLISFAVFGQQKPLFEVNINKSAQSEATLEEVQQLILENYYYDGVTQSDLDWAAIEGILRHISPPQSPELATLWTDEEYEKILNSLKGIKVTLGFNSTFNATDGSLTVTSVLDGSEAKNKLAVNDRILRIDDVSLKGKSINEVNQLLDGEVNQTSALKVVRDIEIFDVNLSRDSLRVENLIVTKIPNNDIAFIELKKITLGMAEELQKEIEDFRSEGITKIILDLRNNTGGVLNEGVNIAKLFMRKNDIVLRTQNRSNGVTNYVADRDQFYDLKIAVLINENTASAAEIISSALQDHDRAVLIGKKTYGKGVIETTFTLKNDYRLKFITNAMYSPKGVSWESNGILPDFYVDQSQANYKEVVALDISDRLRRDLHLSTALKLLK